MKRGTRWGARGTAKRLDGGDPQLGREQPSLDSAAIEPSAGQLDIEAVIRASQALSGEMLLPRLIEKLVRIAVEQAGAERGLFILTQGSEAHIEAEASARSGTIEVVVRKRQLTPSDLPQSALHYVIRTQESVLLDDASSDNAYSKDEYVLQNRSKSVLCLPIVKQAKLVGALYLENNLAPGVFTPDRIAGLQLLASQAAISLENASLYSDLQLQAGLLQRLPVSAWTLKPDGTPDFVNRVWLEVAGQTLDYIRSDPEAWMSAVHPEDRETVLKIFWDGVRAGQDFAMEARTLCTQDGTYRWHLHQAVVLRDADGKVLKFVGTSTDIGEQKRAEEDARANEIRLREITSDLDRRVAQRTKELAEANEDLQLQAGLLQNLPVSAWTLKPDGRPDFVNRVWLEVAGQTLAFVRSHPEAWMTAVHPDDRETVARAFWEGVSTGRSFAMESRTLCAPDGIYRWHLNQAVVLRDADGRVLKFVGTTTDIDDQKRAEEDARANELRLREMTADLDRRVAQRTRELAEANEDLQLQVELLQRLPVSAWTLKPDGTPDFVNQVWLEYSGQTLDFVRSHPESWMAAIHAEDREAALRAFWHGVRSGQGFAMETRYLRARDGTYRWHINQAVVLRDAEGRVLKFVGTTTDIDDQKRAEEALNKARSELAQVVRITSLGVVTASIAHEVNQPLSGIITNASTCLRMLDVDPPNLDGARETARRTIRDGHRASDVITRLRTLYSKKEPSLEPMDLNEAAREVIALLLSELQRDGVILQHEFANHLHNVEGDRIQLQQVIHNLVRNASDAMRDIADRPRRLLIRTEQAGENVCVTVQDSGVGFNPASADRLFESFYTTKPEGMGIGLSVSRSIIEAHGGRLWAAANDGPGATFAFSIPRDIQRSNGEGGQLAVR
jgi:PAS domain S-box-containing protein